MRALLLGGMLAATLSAFESSNLQLLYSAGFDSDVFIYDTVDGAKTTLTFEHASSWELGDLFMFVDMTEGTKFDGTRSDLYAELSPRISLDRLFGHRPDRGRVGDLYLASQLNAGHGYRAYLLGLGTDLRLEGFDFVSLNLYAKSQTVGNDTAQLTLAYRTRPWMGLHLNGFADMTGYELNTQNQLLYDAGNLTGTPERFFLGTEWLYYEDRDADVRTSVWQVMAKYRF